MSIIEIRRNKAAFTLVEIMIVVAIIGLLAALAIPGFVKARKQSQGRRIFNDVRKIDDAIDQYALETGKKDGDAVWLHNECPGSGCACIWSFFKKRGIGEGEGMYKTPTDILGNAFVFGTIGSNQVRIAEATKAALDGVGIDWGIY